MAYICDYCGKRRIVGHNVSHAKNRTRRLFLPNLQKLKVLYKGQKKAVKFCSKCIKTLHKDLKLGPYKVIAYKKEEEKIKVKPALKSLHKKNRKNRESRESRKNSRRKTGKSEGKDQNRRYCGEVRLRTDERTP